MSREKSLPTDSGIDIELLIRRLAEAQSTIEVALAGHVDAVMDPLTGGSILLCHAQRALTESENRYRRLLARMPALIFELDINGTTLFVSDALTDMTGFCAADLTGRNWWETLVPVDWPQTSSALLERCRAGDVTHYEIVVTSKAGAPITLDVNSANRYRSDGRLERLVCCAVDISERKRADDALRQSEAQFRRMCEVSPIGVFACDREGRNLYGNAACRPVIGLGRRGDLGMSWLSAIHPDDRARLTADWQAAIAQQTAYAGEGRSLHADGTVAWWRVNAAPIQDGGRHLGWVGTLQDITSAKHLEQALRDDVVRREFTLAATGIGLWEQDLTTGRVTWSDTMEMIHGIPRRAFPTTLEAFLTLVHPDDRPELVHSLTGTLAEGTAYHTEYRNLRPDGSMHWIEGKARALRDPDGRLSRILGVDQDITKRKLAEVALVESEQAYRSTFDALPVGIAHVSLDGRWLRVNQRLCDLLGYSAAELKKVDFGGLTHPDDLGRDAQAIDQMIAGTLDRLVREKRYRRRDGSFVWTMSIVSLHRDADGEPQYFIPMIEDITERRNLEEQFRQAQKMEAIGQLAGGVAHDFNNVLTAIIGFSELVLASADISEPIRADVEEILNAGQRAAALTRQLLAFSRRQVLQPQILNLNVVVSGMEVMLRRLIGENVELVTHVSGRLGIVNADKGQIEQALMNLAVNARDAMPAGGTLTIEVANVMINAVFNASHPAATIGEHVLLAISDTGIGMNSTILAHLFEPFYTTKERGKGTGLGLATVYGVVKQSQGFIQVESEPGRGTKFKIYLPVSQHQPMVVERGLTGPSHRTGTETILLVEDQSEVRVVVRQVLVRHGYTVIAASSGAEALALLEEHAGPVDLLLTDIVMPHMSGHELARRVTTYRRELRVLYMSGYIDNIVSEPTVRGSGPAFIQKPFTPQRLLEGVREILDARHPRPFEQPSPRR